MLMEMAMAMRPPSPTGIQVLLSKYVSITSFQRKDFLNHSNTEKRGVFPSGLALAGN